MNARQKLNIAYMQGALVVAAAIGLVVESGLAFLITAAILLAASLYSGEIRPRRPS